MKLTINNVKIPEGYKTNKNTKIFNVLVFEEDGSLNSSELWAAFDKTHLKKSIQKFWDVTAEILEDKWDDLIIISEIGTIWNQVEELDLFDIDIMKNKKIGSKILDLENEIEFMKEQGITKGLRLKKQELKKLHIQLSSKTLGETNDHQAYRW